MNTNNKHKPTEADLDAWLAKKTDIPLSSDFDERTFARIRSENVTALSPILLFCQQQFIPLAAAALLVVSLGIYSIQKNSFSIYTDAEYIAIEELFLLQDNVETLASLDSMSSVNFDF